jgi:hypothetical protein
MLEARSEAIPHPVGLTVHPHMVHRTQGEAHVGRAQRGRCQGVRGSEP